MDRFFGGNPLVVVLKLAVASVVVGVVMAALGLDVFGLVRSVEALVHRIYEAGFDAIRWLVDYFLIGAAVVFPIWLVVRLMKTVGRRGDPAP